MTNDLPEFHLHFAIVDLNVLPETLEHIIRYRQQPKTDYPDDSDYFIEGSVQWWRGIRIWLSLCKMQDGVVVLATRKEYSKALLPRQVAQLAADHFWAELTAKGLHMEVLR